MNSLQLMEDAHDIKSTFDHNLRPSITFSGEIDVYVNHPGCDFTFRMPVSTSSEIKALRVDITLVPGEKTIESLQLGGEYADGFTLGGFSSPHHVDVPYPCESLKALKLAIQDRQDLLVGDVGYLNDYIAVAYGLILDAQKYVVTPFVGNEREAERGYC